MEGLELMNSQKVGKKMVLEKAPDARRAKTEE